MQLFLGIALLTFVLAASVVGLRLLALARRTRQLPELLVGVGFSLIGLLGYPLAMLSGFGRGSGNGLPCSVNDRLSTERSGTPSGAKKSSVSL